MKKRGRGKQHDLTARDRELTERNDLPRDDGPLRVALEAVYDDFLDVHGAFWVVVE